MTPISHRQLGRCATIAMALFVAACQATPSAAPSGAPAATTSGTPSPTASAAASPAARPVYTGEALAEAVREAVSTSAIMNDLAELEQRSWDEAYRSAGSQGHDAAVAYVVGELQQTGFEVEVQSVDVPVFRQQAPTILNVAMEDGEPFEDLTDFKAMLFSASGEVTAPVFPLGFDPNPTPDTIGRGCSPSDWTNVPAGVIALVQPANCRRHDVVVNAQAAGVVAVVTAYPGWSRDAVLRPTLIEPADIHVPAIGATMDVGRALAAEATAGRPVHLEVHASTTTRADANVIAELPGDPEHVVMLGGHFDSVIDGPGINDNGSGTMTLLEIARALGSVRSSVRSTVRIAFWTGEELGLVGSRAYVAALSGPELARLDAYLNFDMLGSFNGVRLIYDAAGTSRPVAGALIQGLFQAALDADGRTWATANLGGGSDHFAFDQSGIPTGGLFSGANELKTEEQAALFGGAAGEARDSCYHRWCDESSHINVAILNDLARAAAWVAGRLAAGDLVIPPG